MAYFKYVPDLLYRSLQQQGSSFDTAKVKNLFRRGKIRDDIYNVVVYFDKYSIKGDDRPDNVANEIYGSSEYDWIVLLSNNIINVRDEWPLDNRSFENYLKSKYTTAERSQIKHYETSEIRDSRNRLIRKDELIINNESYDDYTFSYFDGVTLITLDKTDLTPITNYDYEVGLNEDKRNIYLLKSRFLNTVVQNLGNIMKYENSSQYINKTTKKTVA